MGTPEGWVLAGSAPRDYTTDTEDVAGEAGRVAVLRARGARPGGFGTLMQTFAADDYRGRRVRLSARVRTDAVVGWCGLWMRVDGPHRRALAFDNMERRPVKGTTAWARYEVVLDVAHDAEAVAFGLILDGEGAAWLRDVTLEEVGTDVPTTDPPLPRAPRNLDFAAG